MLVGVRALPLSYLGGAWEIRMTASMRHDINYEVVSIDYTQLLLLPEMITATWGAEWSVFCSGKFFGWWRLSLLKGYQ